MSQTSSHPRLGVSSTQRLSAWLLLVALLAFGVYFNSLKNGFAFDDVGIIKDNVHVTSLEWSAIWTDNYWPKADGVPPDILYRPVTLWSYLANEWLSPGKPMGFHLVNVLLHALVTVLVTVLTWRLTGERAIAVVVGVLFAVHPLHTEAVANVVGRAELLATAWSLLALLIYFPPIPLKEELKSASFCIFVPLIQATLALAGGLAALGAAYCFIPAGDTRWVALFFFGCLGGSVALIFSTIVLSLFRVRGVKEAVPAWRGPLVAVCFFVALLCKESPAMLLPAIVGIDAWRWARFDRAARPSFIPWFGLQALRYYLPMAIFLGLYLAMRINACGLMKSAGAVHPVVNLLVIATPLERLVTPFALLTRYLALTFWPVHLSADYSAPSIRPTSDLISPFPLIGFLLCILAAIIPLRTWRKAPQLMLIVGLFFASYFLVSNAIRIGTIFGERLFYWPSAFILMLVAWAAVRAYQWGVLRQLLVTRSIAAVMLLAAVIGMSRRTWVRNTDWMDNLPLAIATGRDNPNSAKACFWAGNILVWSDRPEYEAFGKELLDRAAELYPKFAAVHWEIAKYYGRHGQLGASLVSLSHAVQFDPGAHLSRTATSEIFRDLKKADPETYMPQLIAERAAHPEDNAVYFALALAYHAQGRWEDAEANAVKALTIGRGEESIDSRFHEAAAELAMIRFDHGQRIAGLNLFRMYVMSVRNSADARYAMASLLLQMDLKEYPTAIAEAEMNLARADAIEPNNPRAREIRGEIYRLRHEGLRATADAVPHQLFPAVELTAPSQEGGHAP